ncbi:hypothetical protein [Actinomadura sp. WMMA1423]|uniref:hypothetical protein n=1 Tax=Actinomadura sp. WMMA1423 TaxID=2591108 RepID=UPI0011469AFE|nr:hypothetical protein [Actinomadura sp. WMMA1423]
MTARGITYDTGFVNAGIATLRVLDPDAVRHDLAVIRDRLHCTAVRPTGGDQDRLELVSRLAVEAGLAVWYSPFTCDLTADESLDFLIDGAGRAERLRQAGGEVIFVCGAELSFVNIGILPGERIEDRVPLLPAIHATTPLPADAADRLNAFFATAVPAVRAVFGGPLSYASTMAERVDWRPFDIVGVDAYRSAGGTPDFEEVLAGLVALGKPVAVTEFGSSTYTGSAAKGALAEDVVVWEGVDPVRLAVPCERDEREQAENLVDLLGVFDRVGVAATFVHTFGFWHMAHRDDPETDLDRAGYGLVRFRGNGADAALRPRWEPKAAFHAIAGEHRRRRGRR